MNASEKSDSKTPTTEAQSTVWLGQHPRFIFADRFADRAEARETEANTAGRN